MTERSRENRHTMHTGSSRYMLSWRCTPRLCSQSPSAVMAPRERANPRAQGAGRGWEWLFAAAPNSRNSGVKNSPLRVYSLTEKMAPYMAFKAGSWEARP